MSLLKEKYTLENIQTAHNVNYSGSNAMMSFFLQVTMEMFKRQGDKISELETHLKSDKPTDEKLAEGKFGCHFHSLCHVDFNYWMSLLE